MLMLVLEPMSSRRVPDALKCWTISPAPMTTCEKVYTILFVWGWVVPVEMRIGCQITGSWIGGWELTNVHAGSQTGWFWRAASTFNHRATSSGPYFYLSISTLMAKYLYIVIWLNPKKKSYNHVLTACETQVNTVGSFLLKYIQEHFLTTYSMIHILSYVTYNLTI